MDMLCSRFREIVAETGDRPQDVFWHVRAQMMRHMRECSRCYRWASANAKPTTAEQKAAELALMDSDFENPEFCKIVFG